MKTKLTFWGSMLFLLSLSILLTIYLAWIFYPLEIEWLNLADRVYLKPETIQYAVFYSHGSRFLSDISSSLASSKVRRAFFVCFPNSSSSSST